MPAIDHAKHYGWSRALMRVVADSARYSRLSVAAVLARVLEERRRRPTRAFDHFRQNEMSAGSYACLSDRLEAMAAPSDLLHPGLLPPGDCSKGKFLQVVSSCFSPIEYYDRFVPANECERIDVFLTQPMVEACLHIPSWTLAHRGIDRGLERLAFANILPAAVVRRRTKSTPQEVYDHFVASNRPQIVDYLLDGELVRQDMLSRPKLISALHRFSGDDALKPLAVLNLLQLEAWLRGWS